MQPLPGEDSVLTSSCVPVSLISTETGREAGEPGRSTTAALHRGCDHGRGGGEVM